MEPYRLINVVVAHNGPIRCIAHGPTPQEILTGCQADAPNLRRWRYSEDLLSIEEIGSPIFHDHWVTAVTSLPADSTRNVFPDGCIITGCMDTKIRIFDINGNLIATLANGHSKGVISFSWTKNYELLSGGWDGKAILWSLIELREVRSFGPHENGVHVLALSNGYIATTSTGESVNSKPANFRLRFWHPETCQLVSPPISDHLGPIRSIQELPGINGFMTTSNDGTVMIRSLEGHVLETLVHPLQDDSPPFLLDCSALDTSTGTDFVSCGEDGSLVVWSGNNLLQSIPHPSTVWTVFGLKGSSTGNFVSGGNDGILRVFSRLPQYNAVESVVQLTNDFINEVTEVIKKKTSGAGPSAEDLAKAPLWENRGSIQGKSEHQIMVFNREGSLIAAEWASGAWVFIGEVTGSGGGGSNEGIGTSDAGFVNGVRYDHVLPVEIETSTGLKNLQLGYNNLENPFNAAQRFINDNGIGQYYLQQIADWIIARQGQNAGTAAAYSQSAPSTNSPTAAPALQVTALDGHVLGGPVTFSDIPNLSKVLTKLEELDNSIEDPSVRIRPEEWSNLRDLFRTLEDQSHYHSSTITMEEIQSILAILQRWNRGTATFSTTAPTAAASTLAHKNSLFIVYDILRMVLIHPAAIELFLLYPITAAGRSFGGLAARGPIALRDILQETFHVLDYHYQAAKSNAANGLSHQVLLTLFRFLANLFKHSIYANTKELRNNPTIASATMLGNPVLAAYNDIYNILDEMMYRYLLPTTVGPATANTNVYLHSNKLVRAAAISWLQNFIYTAVVTKNVNLSGLFAKYISSATIHGQISFYGITTQHLLTVLELEKESAATVYRALEILATIYVIQCNRNNEAGGAGEEKKILQVLLKTNQNQLTLMNTGNFWQNKENTKEISEMIQAFLKL